MSVKKLLISGGCERTNGFELGDGKQYQKAVLLELDLRTGKFREVFSKATGGKNYPDEHPNLQFTAGCIESNRLWLPTDTEIYVLDIPSLNQIDVISHPFFHNIHSVHVFEDQLVVTNTGLDQVVFLQKHSGELINIIQADSKDPWYRFSRDMDYRKVHSTRPHECHPNFVLKLNGDLWVTRCIQEDAINISNPAEKIDISQGSVISVHDGVVWEGRIIFTRVDGKLAIFDAHTRRFVENRNIFEGTGEAPKAWCRGICIDGDIFYVGFSKVRRTRSRQKLDFLMGKNAGFRPADSAEIIAYSFKEKRIIKVFSSPKGLLDTVYGIMSPD